MAREEGGGKAGSRKRNELLSVNFSGLLLCSHPFNIFLLVHYVSDHLALLLSVHPAVVVRDCRFKRPGGNDGGSAIRCSCV